MDLYDNIVVSSRIRLARNISGINFFTRLTNSERALGITKGLYEILEPKGFEFHTLKNLTYNKCVSLLERHIISRELIENKDISSYAISEDERVIIMICEEDHIREQCIYPSFNLLKAYNQISEIDDRILENFPIAYDERYGFITASPSNLGTAMRASCMMFLPALYKFGKINEMIKKAKEKGLTVRGFFGEGSDAFGYFYQISNQNSLGLTEEEIIDEVSDFVLKLCEKEDNLRGRLLDENYDEIKDSSSRALGTLLYAHKLSEAELFKNLSELKLGVCLGLIEIKDEGGLDELYSCAGDASLSEEFEDAKGKENLLRAQYTKDRISKLL